MTVDRTTHLSSVPAVDAILAGDAGKADTVAVYSRPGFDGRATVIVEITDAHRNLMARSVIDTDATREVAADFLLADSPLERCSTWRIDPIHRHKRLVSMVTMRTSESVSDYSQQRAKSLTA